MKKFPQDFVWGTATAAYQIEGACDRDGRGESIWDRYCRTPGKILDGCSGADGCDHYDHYEEDIALMEELHIQAYRFSIAWTRIYPEGHGRINEAGVKFYQNLVKCLKAHGISPVVTLYHWDLPQKLQDIGGWTNPLTVDYFVEYAKTVFEMLGDDVDLWITFNEPYCTSFVGNWVGRHAPGLRDYETAVLVAHHLLLAHGRTVQEFRKMQLTGKIGITINMDYCYPATGKRDDIEAAERMQLAHNQWFTDPIFRGSYPEKIVALYREQGVMPEIPQSEMDDIFQPIDFLGLNNYYSLKISKDESVYPLGIKDEFYGPDRTQMNWGVNPEGIHDLLTQIRKNYGDIPIYITENGAAYPDVVSDDGSIDDEERRSYLERYLRSVYRAIGDGVPVKGYFQWSFMYNFEWAHGYTKRFGMVYVDYVTKKRTVKKSGRWYAGVIAEGGLPE